MEPKRHAFRTIEYPRNRFPIIDYLRVAQRKPLIHLLLEADVTQARSMIRERRLAAGEQLSFTAFLVGCVAKAVDEDKLAHAYRRWRKLVIYEDVDVCVLVEHQVGDRRLPAPHVIRSANNRSVEEIHRDIRRFQQGGVQQADPWRLSKIYPYFPGFLRRLFWRILLSTPSLMKRVPGTVCVTAAGMFGKGAGWGIPLSGYTLTLTVGGIERRPVMSQDRFLTRDILSLTVSFDHEIVDGAPAARFANRLRELIQAGHGLEALSSQA